VFSNGYNQTVKQRDAFEERIELYILTQSGFQILTVGDSRSQWPRGLRRRSLAVRLLRLWVRIPPRAWKFVVSVVCCQVEVSATD